MKDRVGGHGDGQDARDARRPDRKVERLFEGSVTLAKRGVDWGSMRAELVTMQRGNVVTIELLTGSHVLFMGVKGDPHNASVVAEGVPNWQGTKGKGGSAFYAAGRRMRSRQSEGIGTTLVLFFDENAIEDLLHDERRLHWQSRPSADDAFIAASSAELAMALEDEADDLAPLRAETLATGLHLYSARRFSDLAEPRLAGGDAIGRAIDFIHAALPRAVTLGDLVAASGLPRGQLLAAFRARTNTTPHQYIIRERLSRAQLLLSSTNRLLAEVAQDVGCANAEHLGQMFRQHLKVSPRAWRLMNDRRE